MQFPSNQINNYFTSQFITIFILQLVQLATVLRISLKVFCILSQLNLNPTDERYFQITIDNDKLCLTKYSKSYRKKQNMDNNIIHFHNTCDELFKI